MKAASGIKQQIDVCIGAAGHLVGELTYVKQGHRENTAFVYADSWLTRPDVFKVSPDLDLVRGYQQRKAPSKVDSVFPFGIADTEPDAWGRRVIARDHAKRRKSDPMLQPLTELDYLLAVDDFSRIGALRLRDKSGAFLRSAVAGQRAIPPLIELEQMYIASRAVEKGMESTADLRYLLGRATSLGGMRPKCTVLDNGGVLAIGKFPSINDTRSVTRGEVLALCLAKRAGITAAAARIADVQGTPVAVIKRFDRKEDYSRIPYLSAASMLQASRENDRSYAELADFMRSSHGAFPTADARQLWRRILFNLLITNVDDHLQNHGFLHVSDGHWQLAPAFDINPFPDKDRESKTWLSPEDGPITDVAMLMARCAYFSLTDAQALVVLAEVTSAVSSWKTVATSAAIGLSSREVDDFAPAFEHPAFEEAKRLLA